MAWPDNRSEVSGVTTFLERSISRSRFALDRKPNITSSNKKNAWRQVGTMGGVQPSPGLLRSTFRQKANATRTRELFSLRRIYAWLTFAESRLGG